MYPYLCQALANVVKDYTESDGKKEFFVSFIDVPTTEKLRDLRSTKIGTLIRIRAQIIRTHPVHPELISGTFTCLDCNTVIQNIEQQFKVISVVDNSHNIFTYVTFLSVVVHATYNLSQSGL